MLNEIVLIVFFYVIFAYSVIVHEMFHGYMALWLGDPTAKYAGRLTANPLKHIDLYLTVILPILMMLITGIAFGGAKPVPYNPYNLRNQKWGPTFVALAGPGLNLIIAIFFTIVASFISIPTAIKVDIINNLRTHDWNSLSTVVQGSIGNVMFSFCAMAIFLNVLLAVFNMIPFPPLDGSKLLFALVPIKNETAILLEQYGFVFLFIFIYFFMGPLGILLNFFWQLFFTFSL